MNDIRDPMIFKSGDVNSFLNGTGKIPTLAKILRERDEHKSPTIKGLVEEERTVADKEGLNKSEVCVVHYFSGLSGDSSEAISGMIIRSIGGSNLGFVVAYGKFSVGDNETLMKLIDSTVKTFSSDLKLAVFNNSLSNPCSESSLGK